MCESKLTTIESRSPEQIRQIVDAVRQRFVVTQEYLREGEAMDFYLDEKQSETKKSFVSLLGELKKTGDAAML